MPLADLYVSRIELEKYINDTDCSKCGLSNCSDFMAQLIQGQVKPNECKLLDSKKVEALQTVLESIRLNPHVPALTHPRPGYTGYMGINDPDETSPVLVSGNNQYTEDVLLSVISVFSSPFHIIFTDTGGSTLDMAMIYGTFMPEKIAKALNEMEKKVKIKELVIPGLAASLKEKIEKITGWRVIIGPVSANELPLFLNEFWKG